MSEAYLAGALKHLPAAEITFDRYHVKAQLTKAVDEVRKAEQREHGDLLRHSRYLWLRNPTNLTDRQSERLTELTRHPLKTARAYRWMLRFDAVYLINDPDQAADYLRAFTRGARHSRLAPIIRFAQMIDEYWLGIVNWWHSRISNECPSCCTSWWGCGGDGLGREAGTMMTDGRDGVAWLVSAAVWGSGLAGVVEVGVAAVDPSAGDLPSALPDLDCLGADAELVGDLVEREHALGAEPVVVGGDATVAA